MMGNKNPQSNGSLLHFKWEIIEAHLFAKTSKLTSNIFKKYYIAFSL